MKLFRFRKQWLDPHTLFARGPQIRFGLSVRLRIVIRIIQPSTSSSRRLHWSRIWIYGTDVGFIPFLSASYALV